MVWLQTYELCVLMGNVKSYLHCEVDKLVKSPAFEAGDVGGSKPSFAV